MVVFARLLRQVLAVAGGVAFVRFILFMREIRRMHRYFLKLPSLPEDDQTLILGSATTERFLEGKPLTMETIRRQMMRGLRLRLEECPEIRQQGLLNLWFLNGRLSRMIPNNINIIIITGMDEARFILATKNQHLYQKGQPYEISHPLIGDSVLSTSGEPWKKQRYILDHGFKDDIMARSIPIICDTVDRLVKKLKGVAGRGETFDASEESLKLTMDVLGRFAFSYEFGSVEAPTTDNAPLYNAFNSLLTILNERSVITALHDLRHVPFFHKNNEFDQAMAKLDYHVNKMIADRKKEPAPEKNRDLLDIMLNTNFEGTVRGRLTDKEIRDNMKTMLFAGHDTTAAALTFCLYLLSTNDPAITRAVRKEYEEVLGNRSEPTYEDLQKLQYLDCVLTETLRLYPSAGFTRKAVKDHKIGKFDIPRGAELVFFPYLVQRNPAYYEDPNAFKPERWLQKFEKDNLPLNSELAIISKQFAHFPFSLGIRGCVGKPLAVVELKVAVIKLLQNFDFEHVPGPLFQEEPAVYMTLMPKNIDLRPTLLAQTQTSN